MATDQMWLGLSAPSEWGDAAALVSAVASVLAFIVASCAVFFAWHQIREGRKIQGEVLAQQAYSSYLIKSFENPRFAENYSINASDEDFQKYEWFVSYMLNACELIIDQLPKDGRWRSCVKSQLENHMTYLRDNKWFGANFRDHYSAGFVELIEEVRAGT